MNHVLVAKGLRERQLRVIENVGDHTEYLLGVVEHLVFCYFDLVIVHLLLLNSWLNFSFLICF